MNMASRGRVAGRRRRAEIPRDFQLETFSPENLGPRDTGLTRCSRRASLRAAAASSSIRRRPASPSFKVTRIITLNEEIEHLFLTDAMTERARARLFPNGQYTEMRKAERKRFGETLAWRKDGKKQRLRVIAQETSTVGQDKFQGRDELAHPAWFPLALLLLSRRRSPLVRVDYGGSFSSRIKWSA